MPWKPMQIDRPEVAHNQARLNNEAIVKHVSFRKQVSFMEPHQEPQEERKAQSQSLLDILELQDKELDVEFSEFDYVENVEENSDVDSIGPANGSEMDLEELLADDEEESVEEAEELSFFSIGNIKQKVEQNANARKDEKVNVVVAEQPMGLANSLAMRFD